MKLFPRCYRRFCAFEADFAAIAAREPASHK
jgi:hypothetical protein